ncbi:hypothetical protein GCM10020258_46690 [Sphingomonas yabuuchiae]
MESPSQAQRIGKQVLQRKQLTRSFKAPFDERAWRWPVGSVVPFTFAPLGSVRQLCRVASQDICDEGSNRGACIMELSLEYQEIYAWDGSDKAPVRAIAAPGYNPALDPLAQAVIQAVTPIEQLLIASSYTVGATISAADASGSATATISDHSRVYQDRTVAVTGSTIAGLTSSTTYFFYYDDVARAGGAVTIIATTDGAEAFPSSTAPARHYVGSVTTPAPGGGPSDGGGSSPPGGGEPIRYPEERLPNRKSEHHMAHTAYLPIIADRYGAVVRHIFVAGLDLTGIDMRAQVRLYGDVPGAPLVDLTTVTNGNAQGLRLVEVTSDGIGIPTSHVELVINESTMESLPYAGEIGDVTTLAWDWQVTIAGRKRRLAKGEFQITGDGVTGAESAPANRIAPFGLPSVPSPTSGRPPA